MGPNPEAAWRGPLRRRSARRPSHDTVPGPVRGLSHTQACAGSRCRDALRSRTGFTVLPGRRRPGTALRPPLPEGSTLILQIIRQMRVDDTRRSPPIQAEGLPSNSRARRNTLSSMSIVSRLVDVFCCHNRSFCIRRGNPPQRPGRDPDRPGAGITAARRLLRRR
jgi:hypothetical protein